jgi:hypothetical protein
VNFRHREGAQRFAARRQRELEAPKLKDEVPNVASLRLEVIENGGTASALESKHVRLVVVDHAPALFLIPCGDSSCKEGGHDITRAVMRHLNHDDVDFAVDSECSGSTGTAPCKRSILVKATATYTPRT